MASKVFGCSDLRKKILSYFPIRCKCCNNPIYFKKSIKSNILDYKNRTWRRNRHEVMTDHCNWCYYYIYEYR